MEEETKVEVERGGEELRVAKEKEYGGTGRKEVVGGEEETEVEIERGGGGRAVDGHGGGRVTRVKKWTDLRSA